MRLKRLAIPGIAVLLLTCLIAYIALLRHAPSPHDSATKPRPDSTPPPLREPLRADAIFSLTNKARAENGLYEFTGNQLLNTISEMRAKDMFARQYFEHVSPTGEQPSEVAQTAGYKYKAVAENIAMGHFLTNREIIDGWMQSPGHRKNILSNDMKELGTAVVRGTLKGQDTWIAVQTFGLPLPDFSQCEIPSRELADEIQQKRIEANRLNESLKIQREELDNERRSIEEERNSPSPRTSNNSQQFNKRVKAFNEKSAQYNVGLAELKERLSILQSQIKEYNDTVHAYNACRSSN